jgi:hypothetical protein
MIPHVFSNNSISCVVDGKPYVINSSDSRFQKIKAAVISGKINLLRDLVNQIAKLERITAGQISVEDGIVKYRGKRIHNEVCRRILQNLNEGLPIMPLLRFLNKLMLNKFPSAIEEAYAFIERHQVPITEDGDLIFWKGVNDDNTDCFTGKVHNLPGKTIKMDLSKIHDGNRQDCASGAFHCSSYNFAKNYAGGGKVVMIKVNPAAIVSVPINEGCNKLRAYRYKVLGECNDEGKTKNFVSRKKLKKIIKRDALGRFI